MPHPSHDELRELLQHAAEIVPAEALYRHYSTKDVYRVIGHAILKHSDEVAVIYEPTDYPEVSWITPFSEFIGKVEVNGLVEPRFQPIEL